LVTNAKPHFSTKQRNERFFILFYLNAQKSKKAKISASQKPRKFFGPISDHKESLQEITH
jgi:hypothetical protein